MRNKVKYVHKSVQNMQKQIRKESNLRRAISKTDSKIRNCKQFILKMQNKQKIVNEAIESCTKRISSFEQDETKIAEKIKKLAFQNSSNLTIPLNFGFCLLSYILEMQKSKLYGSTCYHIMRNTSRHFKQTLDNRWPNARHAQTTKLETGDIVTVLHKDRQNDVHRLSNLFRFGSKIENRLSKPGCLESGNKWMHADEMRCKVVYLPYERYYGHKRDCFLVCPDIELDMLFVAFNILTSGATCKRQLGRLRFQLKDINVLNISKRSQLWKM